VQGFVALLQSTGTFCSQERLHPQPFGGTKTIAVTDSEIDELPPRLPETLQELDQARTLLGECANKGLNAKAAQRLEALVGELPSAAVALIWKRALKTYREELQGELGDLG
jgi:hypothetical protein